MDIADRERCDADRAETEAERLDRNWSSKLQELRVTQTGVQLFFAIVGLVLLGAALAGVTVVIFDTVIGRPGAWIAGGAALAALVVFWFVTPLPMRRRADRSY